MKNIFIAIILSLSLISCSESDTPVIVNSTQTNSFFNIENGNKWVYKRYNYNNSNGSYIQTNTIDSVFVVGDTVINSINYKKMYHHTYYDIINSPTNYQLVKDFVRIDSNDHLVRPDGFVLHPGFDTTYQYSHNYYSAYFYDSNSGTYIQNLFGTAEFQLVSGILSFTVEGVNYDLYNYKGDFTGNTSLNIPDNTINYMYGEEIGLVLTRCPYVSGNAFYEDRLIYYELN